MKRCSILDRNANLSSGLTARLIITMATLVNGVAMAA
jgi:hypothetical protein